MSAATTRPEIVRALESKGWMVASVSGTGTMMDSPKNSRDGFRLYVAASSWDLMGFTDSDIDGVAVGRYRTIDEGEDLSEVLEAVKCAEMGVPRDVDERDVDVDGPDVDDGGVEDIEHETDIAYEYADQKLTGMREDGDD